MGVNERGYGRVVWWWERELGSSATGRKGNHVVAIASWKVRSLEKRRTDVPEGDLGAESRVKKSRVDLRAQKGSQRVLFCMGITEISTRTAMGRDDARVWRRTATRGRNTSKGTIGGAEKINDPIDACGAVAVRKRCLVRGQTYRAGEQSVLQWQRVRTEAERERFGGRK